ncbi:MAG: hypothetical protein QOK13_767 [Gaiellaceae bacterium]|nr:hypothetical protein [Gaiellaceae bacterium]
MSTADSPREEPAEEYEAPKVEDLDTSGEPAVTAAGVDCVLG